MKSLQQVVRFCSPDEAIATTARRVRDFYKIDDFFSCRCTELFSFAVCS